MSKVNRAALFHALEQAEDKITTYKAQLAHAKANGSGREVRRARAHLDRWDEEASRIYGILHPISVGSPFDARPAQDECAYKCGWLWNDSEEHRELRWKYVNVCPRCLGQPVSEYDPNYDPEKDHRRFQ